MIEIQLQGYIVAIDPTEIAVMELRTGRKVDNPDHKMHGEWLNEPHLRVRIKGDQSLQLDLDFETNEELVIAYNQLLRSNYETN